MTHNLSNAQSEKVTTLRQLAEWVDYSLLNTLTADPRGNQSGDDHHPRQVFSGHYVPVTPTPLPEPQYVAHSHGLFRELGFDDAFAYSADFMRFFSGDMSCAPTPMHSVGWATGYALSIYGTEYTQQCPFRTGNGYGDGRAISVLEIVSKGKRWEMQLKGAGRTPYCRGADGRAVLRSSVREFLAQEHMHALGIPTSRSLSLFVSQSEVIQRPWYVSGSLSQDPEVMVPNPAAITTRVAPSFIRVGQLELFARRARCGEHPQAEQELADLVRHLIEREYADNIDTTLPFEMQLVPLAIAFRDRLTSLIANWCRVGYCQGNFNSDNCAAGGFTLDYGPFGFCERFDPYYQPWTGGGQHFSFLNQPIAAQKNFAMFCRSLSPLLSDAPEQQQLLDNVSDDFLAIMERKMTDMWAAKLGLANVEHQTVITLLKLLFHSGADFNLFFRTLSSLPTSVDDVTDCFYLKPTDQLLTEWTQWLSNWREALEERGDLQLISQNMKRVNPKYTWREWQIVPAYQQAEQGDFSLIHTLQNVLTHPYDEQSADTEATYCQKRPAQYESAGGIAHYSCSS
ncbi:YdiU family protein [Aestuariibacter sp. A3R04]|uniref:protein adenylyltransferase SelO n=1 Tax=Aestuariibacter sp. A3R04 TaxID=2841571 RepID=UPI001C09565A|nr:protein adenylyltransferase SelO family protein [Aestuariibacter sp. A3R04]MBU3021335.1 YdiU family protein [Aestuariibacter sp. A3R04]